MLTVLLGTDWIMNRNKVLQMIADDVTAEKCNRILLVPELISHDTERRLCASAGDTVSRFAEVLSFSQLCQRVSEAIGCGIQPCLDNGGRVVAMASAARQLHSKLKTYASVETRPDFLISLVTAIDEFKRCCISADDLFAASKCSDGVLAQKLEELGLLMQMYDALCENGLRDPSSQMSWLLEQLEDSTYAEEHVFYVDGFPDFTRQHQLILEHIILHSKQVVVSLTCDSQHTSNPAFEKAGDTAGSIIRFAKEHGISVEIILVDPRNDKLQTVRNSLFHGSITTKQCLKSELQVQQFSSAYEECLAAAKVILDGVQRGNRYRDYAVVCTDIQLYKGVLELVFDRCSIPAYLSGTEDILETPVISAVFSAIDAALSGFEQQDVLRYIKSILSPLDQRTCDLVENYSLIWGVDGSRWLDRWENHPQGLNAIWDDVSYALMDQLNAARDTVIAPLLHFRKSFHAAVNVGQQVDALLQLFDQIDLSKKLQAIADEFEANNDYRSAQILDQLWGILHNALQQMRDVLGNTYWDLEAFTRLFRLLLSQYDVGTIPHLLDAVSCGSVSAMRCQQVKHMIVLGALEGQLPGYSGSTGILTDHERMELRRLGIPLTGGGMDGVQAEFAEIYGVFCGAEESIYVFCPAGQPSYVFDRLSKLSGCNDRIDVSTTYAMSDPMETSAYLHRIGDNLSPHQLSIDAEFLEIDDKIKHQLGSIEKGNIEKLYGKNLYLSASQIDKQADCKLSYFLHYGLNAKERKTATIDPAEFGTYVHAILEKTCRRIMDLGGFKQVSLEDTIAIADIYSKEYIQEHFSQLNSNRSQYLFNRNTNELFLVVEELWHEMQNSSFEPVGCEVAFGDGKELQSIPILSETITARLRGFVDRIDVWRHNGNQYYRVVDYKTGRKDFDYCDVFNGYGLQMLLYLFALEECGELLLGQNPVPAGVQYFPARMPLISAEGQLSEDEAREAYSKLLKRKGLLLNDDEVLFAMEAVQNPQKLCCTRKKDGTLVGDLASREQLQILKSYVFTYLGKLVDDISAGRIDANPYTRGNSHNACVYCPFGAVCHPAAVTGRRNYKTMTAQRFWEEVEKEVERNGR